MAHKGRHERNKDVRMCNYAKRGFEETWWSKKGECGLRVPLKSNNLAPVMLPIGLEVTLATMFRQLPVSRRAE